MKPQEPTETRKAGYAGVAAVGEKVANMAKNLAGSTAATGPPPPPNQGSTSNSNTGNSAENKTKAGKADELFGVPAAAHPTTHTADRATQGLEKSGTGDNRDVLMNKAKQSGTVEATQRSGMGERKPEGAGDAARNPQATGSAIRAEVRK